MNRQHAIRWLACLMVAAAGLALVWLGPSSETPEPDAARIGGATAAAADAAGEAAAHRVAYR